MVKPRNLNLAVLRNDPNEIYEGTCLSTDTKPTNWPDNSILFELDAGTRYYSDSGTWYPVGGNGGSSGGGVNTFNLVEHAIVRTINVVDETGQPTGDTHEFNSAEDYVRISAFGEADAFRAGVLIARGTVNLPFIAYTAETQFIPGYSSEAVECSRASSGYNVAAQCYMIGGTIQLYYNGETPVLGLVSDDAEFVYVGSGNS